VPNISPDPEAGIGAWSELQFVNAMLKGVGRNNEHLYPAVPYTSYQRMALDDVRDLYAFSRTLPPDATASRPHELPLPFRFRRLLGVWKLLFLDGKPFVPDPAKEAVYHRGAYLIEGPAHCAECHSARNVLGGITPSERFAGGAAPDGKGWVPNLTPHANALATWSVTDMAFFLKTGLAPDGSSVGSSMSEVIRNTSRLTPDDRRAMAVYLKALPPRPGRKPATK
jgi:mono/diheme cytochrome c family protein